MQLAKRERKRKREVDRGREGKRERERGWREGGRERETRARVNVKSIIFDKPETLLKYCFFLNMYFLFWYAFQM